MQSTALIDYGSGNLRSAEKALRKAADGLPGAREIVVTDQPEVIARADRIVLPGVGAFAACMAGLEARAGLRQAITEAVKDRGVPFLGVCVGMQLLAERGLEFGVTEGLGWVGGDVAKLEPAAGAKVPHMGWNGLEGLSDHPLLAGLNAGDHMYFTHSYALRPSAEADVIAWTDHGGRFPAAVARGNAAGVQFHPEKSQASGLRLLANFLEWRP